MRSMQWQLGMLGTISAFAYRHRETKKNLCRGGRSQDLPNTDLQPAIRQPKYVRQQYTRSKTVDGVVMDGRAGVVSLITAVHRRCVQEDRFFLERRSSFAFRDVLNIGGEKKVSKPYFGPSVCSYLRSLFDVAITQLFAFCVGSTKQLTNEP